MLLRWMFFVTWVGILIALLADLWMTIRISIKLDQDRADRDVMKHLLTSAMRTAIQMAPEIHVTPPPHEQIEKHPGTMGMDFGVLSLWDWFLAQMRTHVWDRRSGQERRLRA